jgi:hypothetical protein
MKPWPTNHLTADDLDAFHSEALSSEMRLHLETCEDCKRLVVLDREVLQLLSRLPAHEPRVGFADRVLARVTVGAPAPVPVLSFPKLTRRRVAALSALAAGMVASVAWSAANRPALQQWLEGAGASLWSWGTSTWESGWSFLTAQPWFETIRVASGTPIRIAALAAVGVGLYAVGLVALRRLVTPSGAVSNAGA